MIDEGEADWKIIAIDKEDRWAAELNDIDDVERLLPGTVHTIREWFRTYKIPDGKPPNTFALGERCMPRAYALEVVMETHQAWKHLLEQTEEDGGTMASKRNVSVPKLSEMGDQEAIRNDHRMIRNMSSGNNLSALGRPGRR